jgi:hypothetical protein
VTRFCDDSARTRMNESFKAIFKIDPDTADFFKEDITYGDGCGFAGMPPRERVTINQLVAKKDKASLVKWLQSPNAEKQVYAIDGLFQLKEQGVYLTEDELAMIRYVQSKEGEMNTCGGCIYFARPIKEVAAKFIFK